MRWRSRRLMPKAAAAPKSGRGPGTAADGSLRVAVAKKLKPDPPGLIRGGFGDCRIEDPTLNEGTNLAVKNAFLSDLPCKERP